MTIRKSWLFTALFALGCAALSAYINLFGADLSSASSQPRWMIELHIGSAIVGAFLLARFVIGSPAALNGPAFQPTRAVGMVPRVGAVNFFVPGKNSFFSAKRCLQLCGVIACLMLQFISVQTPLPAGERSGPSSPAVRMNANKGSLAT